MHSLLIMFGLSTEVSRLLDGITHPRQIICNALLGYSLLIFKGIRNTLFFKAFALVFLRFMLMQFVFEDKHHKVSASYPERVNIFSEVSHSSWELSY
jgi:hypothetical protein